jgi:nitroreductase
VIGSGAEAADWRAVTPVAAPTASPVALPTPDAASPPPDTIADVILRRGSTRRFAREPIDLAQLAALLDGATRGVPSDSLGPEGVPLNTAYLIVNAVDGLAPGAYVYHRERHALEPLRPMTEDEARARSFFLAWEQDLGGDAAVNVYFLADLDPILARFGDRGYRLAQLGGALVAGKLYLAAYALGLGATGLTFYDDATTTFFAPHAAGKSVMFLIAIGVPAPLG